MTAGEMTQRTVARLSEQLRRYLDDQALFENRRIMTVIRELEQHAVAVRRAPPQGVFMELNEPAPLVELPMERPLFLPPVRPVIQQQELEVGADELSTDALFQQFHVDKGARSLPIPGSRATRYCGWRGLETSVFAINAPSKNGDP